ncbi:MAG: hypothetical protein ACM3RP_08410 [Chitinophagales bacterium]
MARHDRGLARQLSRLEEELEHCEARARYYDERIAELEAARERLLGRQEVEREAAPQETVRTGDPPGQGDQLGGVLGNLMKSLDADTIKAIGEAAKGIDMGALLNAVGGAGGLSQLAGALGGGDAPGGGGLAGLLGGLTGGGGSGGNALDGIGEVIDFFTKRPSGASWSVKDVPKVLKLLGSPNVRALVTAAGRVNSMWKSVKGLQRIVAQNVPALPPPASGEPAAPPAPSPPQIAPVRFTNVGGPPRVLDPWVAAPAR